MGKPFSIEIILEGASLAQNLRKIKLSSISLDLNKKSRATRLLGPARPWGPARGA
jgi:hypothetical protein